MSLYNRRLKRINQRNRITRRVKQLSYNDVDEMSVDLQDIGAKTSKAIGEWITKYDWHNIKKTMPNSEQLTKQWLEVIEAYDSFRRELGFMLIDLGESQDRL